MLNTIRGDEVREMDRMESRLNRLARLHPKAAIARVLDVPYSAGIVDDEGCGALFCGQNGD